MKKAPSLAITLFLLVVTACGASPDEQNECKTDAEERGFTATSVRTDELNGDVSVAVTFGDEGCVGKIKYDGANIGNMTLVMEVPIPNTLNKTDVFLLDDPKIQNLRKLPAILHCFKKE